MTNEVRAALEELSATVARREPTAAILRDAQWALEVAKRAGVLATTSLTRRMGEAAHYEPVLRFVAQYGVVTKRDLPLGNCYADDLLELGEAFGCLERTGKTGWKAVAPRSSKERRWREVAEAARSWAPVTLIRGDASQRARFAEEMAALLRADFPESKFHVLPADPAALAGVGETDVAFIDGLEAMSVDFQTELLFRLREGPSKLILGSSQPPSALQQKVRQGQWREDLFFRITGSGAPIDVTTHASEVPMAVSMAPAPSPSAPSPV